MLFLIILKLVISKSLSCKIICFPRLLTVKRPWQIPHYKKQGLTCGFSFVWLLFQGQPFSPLFSLLFPFALIMVSVPAFSLFLIALEREKVDKYFNAFILLFTYAATDMLSRILRKEINLKSKTLLDLKVNT